MPVTKHTRGGRKLKRFLRNAKQTVGQADGLKVTAGFHDKRIAVLAKQLEDGNPSTNLSPRPAFAQGVPRAQEAGSDVIGKALKSGDKRRGNYAITRSVAQRAADRMADELKASYRTFKGPGNSPLQAARKRGTPGAGRELVGHRGERLIGHIEGRVERE